MCIQIHKTHTIAKSERSKCVGKVCGASGIGGGHSYHVHYLLLSCVPDMLRPERPPHFSVGVFVLHLGSSFQLLTFQDGQLQMHCDRRERAQRLTLKVLCSLGPKGSFVPPHQVH